MHLHILGVCGTFMAGLARLAIEAGHHVTGADRAAYPPMSTQLEAMGVAVHAGYGDESLSPTPDLTVVGNALTRGLPVIEALLSRRLPYVSGPEWLKREILADRRVMAIAGTHGKTTTSAMLAWILEQAGRAPGFLIGGVPGNFDVSARTGSGEPFVIEADEYDTAFFDKRAKFVHYPASTAIINNIEHDHADIYPDVAAIQRQFHHFVRIVPGDGHIVVPAADSRVDEMLALGCWTPLIRFGDLDAPGTGARGWTARLRSDDGSRFEVLRDGDAQAEVGWTVFGAHNVRNALAAMAAAATIGVSPADSAAALADFVPPARRQQHLGDAGGVAVFLDFAHHPSAVRETLQALRHRTRGRLVAILEPRSNTMRAGTHLEALRESLMLADATWVLAEPGLGFDARGALAPVASVQVSDDVASLVDGAAANALPGDTVVVMSNGDSGRIGEPLIGALNGTPSSAHSEGHRT